MGCAGLGLDSLGSEKFGLTNKLGHFGFQVGLVQIDQFLSLRKNLLETVQACGYDGLGLLIP